MQIQSHFEVRTELQLQRVVMRVLPVLVDHQAVVARVLKDGIVLGGWGEPQARQCIEGRQVNILRVTFLVALVANISKREDGV
jgi:hypothetical protein